jgi:hypothetical protein
MSRIGPLRDLLLIRRVGTDSTDLTFPLLKSIAVSVAITVLCSRSALFASWMQLHIGDGLAHLFECEVRTSLERGPQLLTRGESFAMVSARPKELFERAIQILLLPIHETSS